MSWKNTIQTIPEGQEPPKSGSWRDSITETAPEISKTESAVRGAVQGLPIIGPYADEATGLVESALTDKTYDQARDESRKAYHDAEDAHPVAYNGAQIGSGIVGSMAAKIPVVGPALGAGMGAIEGLGRSEADLTKGEYLKAAKDTGTGAVIGATTGYAGNLLGKGVSKLLGSKAVKEAAEETAAGLAATAEVQAAKALGADKVAIQKMGEDKVRQVGRQALDEKVVTPLASNKTMAARNIALKESGGSKMGEVYKEIDDASASTFNPLKTANKIDTELGDFYRSPINRGETKQLDNMLESVSMRGSQDIPLSEAQLLKEELGKAANWKNKLNVSEKEKMAREAYHITSSGIDDAVEAGSKTLNNPELLAKLQAGKKLYGNAVASEKLLSKQLAKKGNNALGLTDNIIGVGATAAMGPKGLAVLAGKKAHDAYGNQMAAVGADKIANIVRTAPETLGKYAPVLEKAAQRGAQSLGLTHYLLMKNDPEYRKQIGQE